MDGSIFRGFLDHIIYISVLHLYRYGVKFLQDLLNELHTNRYPSLAFWSSYHLIHKVAIVKTGQARKHHMAVPVSHSTWKPLLCHYDKAVFDFEGSRYLICIAPYRLRDLERAASTSRGSRTVSCERFPQSNFEQNNSKTIDIV